MEKDMLFELEIITPNQVFYRGDVRMVELRTSEGEMGVYKNHVPLTAIVKPGKAAITEEAERKEASIGEGLILVLKDRVTILTEKAWWPGDKI